PLHDQRDHFHILHRARRARRGARFQAVQALRRAERAQAEYDHAGQIGRPRSAMQSRLLKQAWAKAERAMDRWTAQEQADGRLQSALRLVTPNGLLNTRARAEAEVQSLLTDQSGDTDSFPCACRLGRHACSNTVFAGPVAPGSYVSAVSGAYGRH